MSSGTSPLVTSTVPLSPAGRASRPHSTARPVPLTSSWSAKTRSASIEVHTATTRSRSWRTTTPTCSAPVARAARIAWPTRVTPPIGCRTLGVVDFIRVPSPAARTMTAAGRGVLTREGSRRAAGCHGTPVMLPAADGRSAGRAAGRRAWPAGTASAMMCVAPRRHGRPGPWAARGAPMTATASEASAESRDGRGFTFRAGADDGVAPGDMVIITTADGGRLLGQVVDVAEPVSDQPLTGSRGRHRQPRRQPRRAARRPPALPRRHADPGPPRTSSAASTAPPRAR